MKLIWIGWVINMKRKMCPNPEGYMFLLAFILVLTGFAGLSLEVSDLFRDSYVFIGFITISLSFMVFIVDTSLERVLENRPLIGLKAPYHVCETCKLHMLEGSEHCTQCGICISGFQNHCVFLSTCIGAQNLLLFHMFLLLLNIWCSLSVLIFFLSLSSGGLLNLLLLIISLLSEAYILSVTLLKVFISYINK